MQNTAASLVNNATSLKDIHAACRDLCRRFGFDQFLFIAKRTDLSPPKLNVISGANQTNEPVHCNGMVRITRSEKPPYQDMGRLLATFPDELKQEVASFLLQSPLETPLINSLSFPIEYDENHHGILFLSSSIHKHRPQITDSQLCQARELALGIHQAANKLIKEGETTPVIKLTKRELECLQWAAAGKTNWEIGTILGVTKRTVRFHLINAATKLNTANRYHTLAQAIALGLVKAG